MSHESDGRREKTRKVKRAGYGCGLTEGHLKRCPLQFWLRRSSWRVHVGVFGGVGINLTPPGEKLEDGSNIEISKGWEFDQGIPDPSYPSSKTPSTELEI
jgi:hypothetical protein